MSASLNNETITISLQEYISLRQQSLELEALNNGGVDNWEWYSESFSQMAEDNGFKDWWDFTKNIEQKIEKMQQQCQVNAD